VLVLSQYVEERYARELLGGGAAGVGYLLKDRVADGAEFVDALTPREREVLELIAQGLSNAAIGRRLFVTERALEKHVTSILDKLGIPPDAEHHRRVLAVLAWLDAA
jgi:DNA-binding NarL/FixJ family response regulator